MLEGVLALAGEPAARARDEQVLLLQRGEGRRRGRGPPRRRSPRARPPRRSGRPPRRAAAAGARGRSRESSRAASSDWTVLGSASASTVSSSIRRLTISSANSGLPPERSATWGDDLAAPLPDARQQRGDQLARLVRGQRLQRDRGRVAAAAAPAGPALEQLVAGQADQQQRAAHPARQVVDQVEHSLVGPVDVVDREHQRAAPGDRLDHGAGGREERLAHPLRVVARRGGAPRAARCRAGSRAGRRCARRPARRRARSSARRRPSGASPRRPRAGRCRGSRTRRAGPRPAPSRRSRRRTAGTARAGSSAGRRDSTGRSSARAAGGTCRRRPGRSR